MTTSYREKPPLDGQTIAAIGAGNMAYSLVTGLVRAGLPPSRLRAADVSVAQLERFSALGVSTFTDNAAAIQDADIVLISVKPQILQTVIQALPIRTGQLVISIAAGIPVRTLQSGTSPSQPIVRCMPNTPALVGAGISGLYANEHVTSTLRVRAAALLESVGKVIWVNDEADIDAVTAVSGSGPAYFFYLMESMINAGIELGLDRDTATALTLETAWGAASLARGSDSDPATLRANVTSPGGTTARALAILNDAGVGDAIVRALRGAAERSAELARDY
jgi:pyrroline-5-carboxylate reductase